MSSIKIKIKLPSFGKKEKREIEEIQFSGIKNYIEKLRNTEDISEYYDKLKKHYEKLMEKLEEVKKAFENLENKGEKKFTHLVKRNLEKIKKMDEFNVSSFQQFYTDTFYIVDKIVKTPARTQHEALKYENGKATIELLNSFLKDLQDLKNILAKRYSEYSVVNHFENALKKHKEIEELMKKIEDTEKRIRPLEKEKEDIKKLLEQKIKNLESMGSEVDTKKIVELKKQIDSLNSKIKTINSELKINLSRARRPISKILHSGGDEKIFEFFQNFMENPLENINENFWKMVGIVKQEDVKINENENKRLNEFLKFVEDELKKKIDEYKNLKEEKRQLDNMLEKISSKNEEVLKRLEDEEKNLEEKLKIVNRRLEKLGKEMGNLQTLFRKSIKVLEIMIKKSSGNRVRIKI